MLHYAVSKSLETDEVRHLLAHCRKIVALVYCSQPYRTKLRKVQKDLHMKENQLINDVTRWGSKYKMLERMLERVKATNQIFIEDKKYRSYVITGSQVSLMETPLKTLKGFQELTDFLSREVTITSVIPFLRHIHSLCETVDDEEETAVHIKEVIRGYFATRLELPELLMFLWVAEVLDPRYRALSSDDNSPISTSHWLNLPNQEEVQEYILANAVTIILESNSDTEPEKHAEPQTKTTKKSLVGLLVSKAPSSGSTDSQGQTDVTQEQQCREKLK